MFSLFEIFHRKYKEIDHEKKRFMTSDDLLPYLIIAEWVSDVCTKFDNYTVTQMLNLFS